MTHFNQMEPLFLPAFLRENFAKYFFPKDLPEFFRNFFCQIFSVADWSYFHVFVVVQSSEKLQKKNFGKSFAKDILANYLPYFGKNSKRNSGKKNGYN